MTVFPQRPESFDCAICHRHIDMTERFRFSAWRYPIPPLCLNCEEEWGAGPHNLKRDVRINRQIFALAEAITVEAHRAELGIGALYGRA